MGFMILKDINIDNIKIVNSYNYYKLLYTLPYTTLSGMIVLLQDILIQKYKDYYKIIIKGSSDIKLLNNIDTYLMYTIPNYDKLLKSDNLGHYIILKNNHVSSTLIKKYKTSIHINIFKVTKRASCNHPIVYIL